MNFKKLYKLPFLALLVNVSVGFCQNPIKLGTGGLLPGTPAEIVQNPAAGWTDPSLRVFDGIAYLVVGRDADYNLKDGFNMPYWSIFSSTDFRNWTLEIKIDPEDVNLPASLLACWASDLIQDVNNPSTYYFYYSKGGDGLGVAKLKKVNGKLTLDTGFAPRIIKQGAPNIFDHDPTVFYKNNTPFMLYGRDGFFTDGSASRYKIARLRNDGVNALQDIALANGVDDIDPIILAPGTSPIAGFGAKGATPDKNVARDHGYFHTYNGKNYLSCSGAYIITNQGVTNPLGPYHGYVPATNPTIDRAYGVGPDNRDVEGHASYATYFGQWYHCWEFAFNPVLTRNFRQVQMTYLHYKTNGEMVDDMAFMNPFYKDRLDPNNTIPDFGIYFTNGVGAYDATWPKIEAEWFFKRSAGALKTEHPVKGFQMEGMANDDVLVFPKLRNVPANAVMNFWLSSQTAGGTIEIHTGSDLGPKWGTLTIPSTGNFNVYQKRSVSTTLPAGFYDFYFVFKGTSGDICHLDYFNFVNPTSLVANTKTLEELSTTKEMPLTIYPNPANTMVNINTGSSKSNITIYNQTGNQVYSKKNVIGTISISTIQIGGPGIYLIKTDKETKKLIVN